MTVMRTHRRYIRKYGRATFMVLFGICFGYIGTNIMRALTLDVQFCTIVEHVSPSKNISNVTKRLLMIGVFVPSSEVARAEAVYNTWGRKKVHELIFFSDESPHENHELPFVVLKNLKMTPLESPQNYLEAFAYFYEHHLQSFEYFMLLQVDSYVMIERLEWVLTSILEQRFEGSRGASSKLNHICLSGSRAVLSQSVLKYVYPFLPKNSHRIRIPYLSQEEDIASYVENSLGITCLQPNNVSHLMYEMEKTDLSTFPLDKENMFREALVIYPIPDALSMYRMQIWVQSLSVKFKETNILRVQREINRFLVHIQSENASVENVPFLDDAKNGFFVDHLGFDQDAKAKLHFGDLKENSELDGNQTVVSSRQDDVWHHVTKEEKEIYYARDSDIPHVRNVLRFVEGVVVDSVNKKFKDQQRFKKNYLLYSYFLHCPYYGTQFITDIVLDVEQNSKGKMYRKHSYTQIPFGPLYVKETILTAAETPGVVLLANEHPVAKERDYDNEITNEAWKSVDMEIGNEIQENLEIHPGVGVPYEEEEVVYMILALSGRFTTFERFMEDYVREVVLKDENVVLNIVLYGPDTHSREQVEQVISEVVQEHPKAKIIVNQGNTTNSKSLALELGISKHSSNDLIFFIDVDVTFNSEVFDRIRWFTTRGTQVYYPIVFSEFVPTLARNVETGEDYDHFKYEEKLGHWRTYGYGMVSIYKSDLEEVGGFDTSIIGWGVEDVDLFDKIRKRPNLKILRCPDPSLVHVYHEKKCGRDLDRKRYSMCLNSLFSVFASQTTLTRFIQTNPELLLVGKLKQKRYDRRRRRGKKRNKKIMEQKRKRKLLLKVSDKLNKKNSNN